ncbi:hypothetical protein AVEN_52126-1 [Araneus ventricosus]|uniref:Uncharacterized protein n=1 Tax=Araneus ventricosus TaxID=182803 RepID=A0A4Y2E415_ARAVE|nr:hypothetical protein AVEN_52126-1 [Araneus ventricosus]
MLDLCKKYQNRETIETKGGRGKKPKTSARQESMNVRFEQKKNYISSKGIVKDLKFECVNSNSLPYNQKLRVDKLYPKKKTIHLNPSQNKSQQCTWSLQKNIFRMFHNSGTVFYGHTKANIFSDKKT